MELRREAAISAKSIFLKSMLQPAEETVSMASTVHDRYLEAEVLGADPLKLVWLLYRGGIEAVRNARRHLAQGAIRERSRQINKAWEILLELAGSLNREQGGEISVRLAALYSYMQGRLIEANTRQTDAPLQEVEALLVSLSEAWQSAAFSLESEAAALTPG
jgi:flagellar protein FliS